MWIRPKEILNNLGMVVARTTRVSLFDVIFLLIINIPIAIADTSKLQCRIRPFAC